MYLDFALRGVGIFGSAAFFGMASSISTVTLPMLLRHKRIGAKERVELWSDLYDLVTKRWVPFGLLSAAAYGAAALTTPMSKTLPSAAGIAMFSILPLTLLFVFPSVHKLKSYLEKDKYPGDNEALTTLKKWGALHWLRTIAAGTAAVVGIVDLLQLATRV
ncbi:hypothetical protein CBS9595_003557 [Malassezia furfur]|nr:hypothetical protein CBS9595_003557 [Malassezia furfur]